MIGSRLIYPPPPLICPSIVMLNGQLPGDAMGNPLNSLAWLANLLIEQGRPLKKGNIVMSGSTLATKFAGRGDHAIYSYRWRRFG